MNAVILLEDFAAPPLPCLPSPDPALLNAEYRRGLADGADAARAEGLADLAGALNSAALAAGDLASARAEAADHLLAAVLPILRAITDQLAPWQPGRLLDALTADLGQLCRAGISPVCRIAAAPEQIAHLREQAASMNLEGVTILQGDTTEITFPSGRITFDPDEVPRRISALLDELTPKDTA
ncbi:MAG: hypothetical protein Q4G25_08320 [Paracoccus sp. (in: a-proteobacteria)]|nr:hypothetical protein [Paracoccus sp. (in: a-proteobacteria)]